MTAPEAVAALWRDGHVPRYVNLWVESIENQTTILQMRHGWEYFPFTEIAPRGPIEPFKIRGPLMPPRWKRGDPPFRLQWQTEIDPPKMDSPPGTTTP